MVDPNITRLHAGLARVDAAHTLGELAALYAEIVGYDVSEDDPAATADDVRALLTGFLREALHAYRG